MKGNRPKLRAACRALPWKDVPARRSTDRSRGRRITRTIKVVAAPADLPGWVDFAARSRSPRSAALE